MLASASTDPVVASFICAAIWVLVVVPFLHITFVGVIRDFV
jgi:hypothetical protein